MVKLRHISRDEFCQKTGVSKYDPCISCMIGGVYFMPAFGHYLEIERDGDDVPTYFMKQDNGTWWKFTIIKEGPITGTIVSKFIEDESHKYGGEWKFWKGIYH